MFNYEKIIRKNGRIHCDTEEKANTLLKFMHEKGHEWCSGTPLTKNYYGRYSTKTTYAFNNKKVDFCDLISLQEKIISYEDVVINFKVGDRVSMVFWCEDKMVARGHVTEVDELNQKMFVQNKESDSSEYLEIDMFDIDGCHADDNYRIVYHGWNINVDIKGEEEPVRRKWVTCTRKNVKVNDTVRYHGGYWKGNVEYIRTGIDSFMISLNGADASYSFNDFEIEVDC